MNAYQEMITRHQAEFNSFPMFFAFSQQQFDDGMQKAKWSLRLRVRATDSKRGLRSSIICRS